MKQSNEKAKPVVKPIEKMDAPASAFPSVASSVEKKSPDSGSEKESLQKVTTKVLALINDNAALTGPLAYLRKKDFEVKLVHTLSDGIGELTNFKPDVLLLSWNLKGTDIKKIHPLIGNKFQAQIFIVAEDDSSRTTGGILSSGLPNTILYPVGGVNLYNRIQTALGRSNNSAKNKDPRVRTRSRDVALLGGVEYKKPKKNDIPPDTVWSIRVKSSSISNQIWETIVYKAGVPKYFYYKGDRPPTQWLESKEDNLKEGVYAFMSEKQASSDLLSSFLDYSESNFYEAGAEEPETGQVVEENKKPKLQSEAKENGSASAKVVQKQSSAEVSDPTKLASKKASSESAVKDEKSSDKKEITAQAPKSAAITPAMKRTLLENSVNSAIDQALNSEIKSFEAPILVDKVSNLTVSIIKSPGFQGYLVSGQASDVANASFMKKVYENLENEMKKQNETMSTLCGVLELKLTANSFFL